MAQSYSNRTLRCGQETNRSIDENRELSTQGREPLSWVFSVLFFSFFYMSLLFSCGFLGVDLSRSTSVSVSLSLLMSSCSVIPEARLCFLPLGSGKRLSHLLTPGQHIAPSSECIHIEGCIRYRGERTRELVCPGDQEARGSVYPPNPSLVKEECSPLFSSTSSWPLLQSEHTRPAKKALGLRAKGACCKTLFVGSDGEAGHQNHHYGILLPPSWSKFQKAQQNPGVLKKNHSYSQVVVFFAYYLEHPGNDWSLGQLPLSCDDLC